MHTLNLLAEAARLLCCPDDASPLQLCDNELLCSVCARRFPVLEGQVVEMLPREPVCFSDGSVSERYRRGYLEEFHRPLSIEQYRSPWGAPEHAAPRWVAIRRRQSKEALSLLLGANDTRDRVFCDISAGAGYCTLAFAHCFRLVLHCDLSANSIGYAWKQSRQRGLNNLLFVRMDYFRPPFRGKIDRLLCLDTLIRGEEHELNLLSAIGLSLASDGVAVVDFHNWWHNPLRRIGFLPDNFTGNRSYTRADLRSLFKAAGIVHFEEERFIQEADLGGAVGRLLLQLMPATRFMYRLPAHELANLASVRMRG